jgi:hypothetical protein
VIAHAAQMIISLAVSGSINSLISPSVPMP